ncbi:Uu.00g045570.m01.CDS01 [Anthostomella pinea]|uniref:Uu.00g045570.m01.CDS01 n=1 Tax=Anthostomella pinea TaxID=933095 RepID=A0AAI8YC07_9PEZI|nr:Uu.00g045570.m01.CDS01 [Anthostomella pinea]
MATLTTTPPPPSASTPRSAQRKPLPIPNLSPRRKERSDPSDGVAKDGAEALPIIRDAPVSPVRVKFQPEDWARPGNASIEGGHADLANPEVAPPPPTHSPTYNRARPTKGSPSKKQSLGKPLPATFAVDLPHRTRQEELLSPTIISTGSEQRYVGGVAAPERDGRSISNTPRGDDPNRRSRESDTTASTHQHGSTDSSVETSASSVSGGLNESCERQVLSVSDGTSKKTSIAEGVIPENQSIPQLQYHHQPFLPRVSSVPLESYSRNSSKSDLVENGMAVNRHLTPNSFNVRRSSMPRPQSSYSYYSEFGPRGRSPGLGGGHPRAPSSQSRRSPETRPISYAELLNVPYPQPAPAPITFDNSQLRNNVGNNASLLSAQKTLEMYRQNVKKTNDFSIQYSFAVFLISTAQEQGLNYDEPSRTNPSPKGGPKGDGAESSPTELVREAKSILTRLANGGYPFAQYYLADGYASGLFNKGKEDYNAAFPLFVLAAKHGHAESGYRAGLCYEFGWGCRKDPAKAVQHLRTAASRNHPGAMTRLGKACLSGDLGENRYREGVKWLKRATESADAMYNAAPYHLGTLYETGFGDDIFKDVSYAAELFTQAAELGHPEASYRMGDAYEHGKLNCPRDPALSVHFYTGAADHGHAAAMMGLCAWYMVGADPILDKDEEEAYEWARRSAELGFVKAEYAVGYFTEMGIGCRRDILEANVWYVKAADSGDDRAKQRLAAIRAAVSGDGGTPMDVAPPRNPKMKKSQTKDDKDCMVM